MDNKEKAIRVRVVDKDTLFVYSEDLDAEKRTDWLEDKTIVKVEPYGDATTIYVRDRTEKDIKDADSYGGNLEDA